VGADPNFIPVVEMVLEQHLVHNCVHLVTGRKLITLSHGNYQNNLRYTGWKKATSKMNDVRDEGDARPYVPTQAEQPAHRHQLQQ
jgi:hypothetical protein